MILQLEQINEKEETENINKWTPSIDSRRFEGPNAKVKNLARNIKSAKSHFGAQNDPFLSNTDVKMMKVDISALLKAIEEVENRIRMEKILEKVI